MKIKVKRTEVSVEGGIIFTLIHKHILHILKCELLQTFLFISFVIIFIRVIFAYNNLKT